MSVRDPYQWFEQARFGLFIHWGLYSLLGRGEQVLFRERMNHREYAALAGRFRPRHFDANEWMRLAKAGGMKYAVLTAKHHDGFCLFDSALTDYTSTKQRAERDFVAEYVKACRRHGMRVGLYYSLGDWRFPAFFRGPRRDPKGFASFRSYIHGQVEELCTHYGKIDLLWFDGGWPYDARTWGSEKLDRMIRRHQPHVMINDRLHGGGDGNVKPVGNASRRRRGYYDTAEQRSADRQGAKRPIETLRTTQEIWWGYCRGDNAWKSSRDVIHLLSQSAHQGANLLLNVGPKPDGSFPARFRRILRDAGQWLAINGEAIYSSSSGILDVSTIGRTTVRGNALYVHVLYWPGSSATIYGLANRVRSVRLLGSRRKVRFEQQELYVRLFDLPARAPDRSCTVVKIVVAGQPRQAASVIGLWERDRDTAPLADWTDRTLTQAI